MRFTLASSLLILAIGATTTSTTNAFQFASLSSHRHSITNKVGRTENPSFINAVNVKPTTATRRTFLAVVDKNDEEDEDEKQALDNPYADPNYPELEFINYDDPEYQVDQGVTDEFFDTDAEVEKMREDRRRLNDEFQFETYHADTLKSGDTYKGEWTVYRTSTFLDVATGNDADEDETPKFKKEQLIRKVVTNGKKIKLDDNKEYEFRVDGERLVHEERLAEEKDFEDLDEWEEYVDTNGKFEDDEIVGLRYWPEEMEANDFRGQAGIMCVGNCYTICDSVPLNNSGDKKGEDDEAKYEGPFSELRTEVGIQYKRLRFRVKFDYRVKETDMAEATPNLYLYSMVVCRETRERWPRYDTMSNVDDSITETLFGQPGAPGGLYDPPPVGCEEQSKLYMMLNLEGYASVLFPYKIHQDPEAFDGNGWVQTLDWSPGRIRYQADRKVRGGAKLRELKTLELTEVEAESADKWRPSDSGQNMRQ